MSVPFINYAIIIGGFRVYLQLGTVDLLSSFSHFADQLGASGMKPTTWVTGLAIPAIPMGDFNINSNSPFPP